MFGAINLVGQGGGDVTGGGVISSGSGSTSTVSTASAPAVGQPAGSILTSGGSSSGFSRLFQDRVISDIYYLGDKPYSDESMFDAEMAIATLPPGVKAGLILALVLIAAKVIK